LAIVLALMLGIGANSAMFSAVDALLLRPFRYRDPATLAILWNRDAQGGTGKFISAADFLDWRAQAKSFSDLAAWRGTSYIVTGGDRPEQISGATVTANFFRTLGVKPVLGRTFLPEEDGIDRPAAASKVAVISYRMWQDTLGADPNVLGRTMKLSSNPYAIIGVLPPDFQFYSRLTNIWIPITLNQNRDYHYLFVFGRLKAPRERAQAEMTTVVRAIEAANPKSNKGWDVQVEDLRESLINHSFRTRLLLLFGAVGLVLLIACTNIASLLLARSAGRNREIAVRISLGATHARITRQLLTESVLLSILGGVLGLGLAWLLIRAAPGIVPPDAIPIAAPIELSYVVVLFTLGISVITGILFGLAPALTATRPDIQETLKDSSRGATSGRGRQRFRKLMVTAEIAVALMLLASAGLMTESLRKMYDVDLGFNLKHVLMLRLFLPSAKYNARQALAFHREALGRIAALPGVSGVAVGSNRPLGHFSMEVPFDMDGAPPRDISEKPAVPYVSISADYVRTLGIPLKRGRTFTEADNENAPPVAIVNEAFAKRYFPQENPVGLRVQLNRPILGKNGFEDTVHPEIVGVIGNVRPADLAATADPILYVPHAQSIWTAVSWFAVRTAADPGGLTAAIRRQLMDIDREQPIDQVSSIEAEFETRFAEPRFQTQLMATFALLALILAIVGIYGVNAYAMVQRRHEIGVRMALGASPRVLLGAMLMQGMRLTVIGIVMGLTGAVAMASLLKSVLVGVSATDPATLACVAAILGVVAMVACYVPARKATKIDPAIALRQQ
jgi:putative ABC transport system permease protein